MGREKKMRKISEFGLVENCDYYRETKAGDDSNYSDHMSFSSCRADAVQVL